MLKTTLTFIYFITCINLVLLNFFVHFISMGLDYIQESGEEVADGLHD